MRPWTVVFRNVGGSALFAPVKDAESADEAVKLARLGALRHFSAQDLNAAQEIEVRRGHKGLDIDDLIARFGELE